MLAFAIKPVVFLGAALAGVPGAGREDPLLVTLVEEALARNPALAVATEVVAQAAARPSQAGALADPMFSVGYRNDGWSPSLGAESMTVLWLGVAQDLPYPGKRQLRRDLARNRLESTTQLGERARLDVVATVKRSYYALVEARELIRLLSEEESTWRQMEGVTRARYAVGEGAQQDVLRVQIELTRLEERRAQLETDATVRLAELNAAVGRPVGQPLETASATARTPLVETLDETLQKMRERSPELAAARLAIDEAGIGVALAEKERKPDFRVGGAYMNRGSLPPMWEAELGVNLPVRREKLDASLSEAKALEREARARLETVELALRSRSEERYARLKAQERIAALYEDGIIPQDRLSVEAALASYGAGNVPFVTVLEALSRLYLDRALFVRARTTRAELEAALESASLEETTMRLPAIAEMDR